MTNNNDKSESESSNRPESPPVVSDNGSEKILEEAQKIKPNKTESE